MESHLSGIRKRIRRPAVGHDSRPDQSIDEERFVIIGMSSNRILVIVVHTIRGERIRLISARPVTKHERRNYEEASL
jgi:uncharacterized DUF497 family protein